MGEDNKPVVKAVSRNLFQWYFLLSVSILSISSPFLPFYPVFPCFELAPQIQLRALGSDVSSPSRENDICNYRGLAAIALFVYFEPRERSECVFSLVAANVCPQML